MRKAVTFVLVALVIPFITWGQSARNPSYGCNLSVSIDSVIVRPCFRITGGSCGCSNTLWAVVNGGTAPYTYSWTTTGGYISGTADTLYGACYELWFVKVKDANGCIDSSSLNVVVPGTTTDTSSSTTTTGINQHTSSSSLKLYPVPASNQLNVSLGGASNSAHMEVYDMLGNKLLAQNVNDGTTLLSIDISAFANGNYFLKIIGSNGQKTVKFTVDK